MNAPPATFAPYRDAALELLIELEGAHLEVVLIPATEAKHSLHSVRAVQEANCEWYRKMAHSYQSSRKRRSFKSDTKIKRQHTIRALERIIKGQIKGTYVERLWPFVLEKAQEIESYKSGPSPARFQERGYNYNEEVQQVR